MKKSKITIILSLALAIVVLMAFAPAAFAASAQDAYTPTIDVDSKTITITDEQGLQWLSDYSAGEATVENVPVTFDGWTINLAFDEIVYSQASWTPITNFHGKMVGQPGTAKYSTIRGLKVSVSTGAGLCGNISYSGSKPSFANIEIADSEFTASGNYAGAFAGNGYTATFDNCCATDVTVTAARFLGGIVGMSYGDISNCKLLGKSSVTATASFLGIYGDNAGGIVGLMGEGGMTITSCTVEGATITGDRQVGGIAGLANYGNSVLSCEVTNCTVTARSSRIWGTDTTPAAGGVVGQVNCTAGYTNKVEGNTVTGCTITSGLSQYTGWLIGDGVTRVKGELLTADNVNGGGNNVDVEVGGSESAR